MTQLTTHCTNFQTLQLNDRESRATYIKETLDTLGIVYVQDNFQTPDPRRVLKRVRPPIENILVRLHGEGELKVITTHYDVANPESENANDNGVAICIVLCLCEAFRDNNQNALIVFTDQEETGFGGAHKLGFDLRNGIHGQHNGQVLNLDMCGIGESIFIEQPTSRTFSFLQQRLEEIAPEDSFAMRLPPQDGYALRHEGLDAVTIGLFSKDYNAWNGIHTKKDTWNRIEIENAQKILNLVLQY